MRILNFGSLNIDFVYTVDHFARSGETLLSSYRAIFPGGKGLNQSLAIARCCCEAKKIRLFHAGIIGKDDGLFLKEMLDKSGVNTDYIRKSDSVTGRTVTQVDHFGRNCVILFGGANAELQSDFIDSVFQHFSADDYLVLQNEINGAAYLMQKAHKKGMKIFFNPSPYNDMIDVLPLEFVSCFILDATEACELCHTPAGTPDILLSAFEKRFPAAEVVLMFGKKGAVYRKGSMVYHHGAYRVPVLDTAASADTFIGYFIGCRAQGMNAHDILKYASAASAIKISRRGAASAIPTVQEVLAADLKLMES